MEADTCNNDERQKSHVHPFRGRSCLSTSWIMTRHFTSRATPPVYTSGRTKPPSLLGFHGRGGMGQKLGVGVGFLGFSFLFSGFGYTSRWTFETVCTYGKAIWVLGLKTPNVRVKPKPKNTPNVRATPNVRVLPKPKKCRHGTTRNDTTRT